MATDFPNSPANGATHTFGGTTYTYSTSVGAWTAGSSAGGASVTVSETAPSSPAEGDLWFDPSVLKTFVYYNDGSANQWVQSNPTGAGGSGGGGGGASVTSSDTAPSSPSAGDLWYKSDTNALYVYYNDGDSNQWVGVSGPAGPTGATGATGASGGAGVASVYATINNLPMTGNSAGDQAYVTANNTLYFWNGSGWYKIALINATPSISGVSSSYALAIDGTATTVTITATDPEGLPITYSILSDTSGNIATVSQGTGASTNVFTITPSTNTAYAGSFTLTFRASDGVNIATAPATFTLQFSVENSRYTTALITSVGANNATNTSFDDKSTSNHTITANGNVTQTTFSPYASGGYSYFFDGSGDYLEIDDGTWLTLGNGNFCFETWIYNTATTGASQYICGQANSAGHANSVSAELYINSSRNLQGGIYVGSQKYATSTGTIPLNTWTHVALVRNGGNIQLYINGTKDGENTSAGTDSANDQSTHFSIGRGGEVNSLYFNGYITDFRFVKGSSVHTGNFTAPTERLTAITNTELLTCHLPYIADGSTNGQTIAVNGNTKATTFAPFDAQEYSASSHGGSLYNDGTGTNYLSVTSNDFQFGTSDDFVIEAWAYPTATPSNAAQVFDNRGAANGLNLALNSSNQFASYSEPLASQLTSTAKTLNQWYHVAVVRYNGTRRLFINGVSEASVADTGDYNSNSVIIASRHSQDQQAWAGNISDLRVIRGTIPSAYQGTSLTIPAAPLTAVTNTKLLVQSTDAGIIDKSQSVKTITLNGDVKSSTAQSKYLTSSMYFDGTGDYISTEKNGNFLNDGPWTMEMWIRPSGTGNQTIGPSFGGGAGAWNSSNGHQWINYNYNGTFYVQYYGTNNSHNTIAITGGFPFAADTWYHYAISWDGTTLRFFKDGTSIHTTTTFTPQDMTATNMNLGRMNDNAYYFAGYYSDVRITEGLARYTSNFTPPAAALKG